MADPTYAAIAPLATIQVAASVIVTAILTPILTSWMYKKVQKERAEKGIVVDETETEEAAAATAK
jgi:2-keto-3-deoxygluconate permease